MCVLRWTGSALYTILFIHWYTPKFPVRHVILTPNQQRQNFVLTSVFILILYGHHIYHIISYLLCELL